MLLMHNNIACCCWSKQSIWNTVGAHYYMLHPPIFSENAANVHCLSTQHNAAYQNTVNPLQWCTLVIFTECCISYTAFCTLHSSHFCILQHNTKWQLTSTHWTLHDALYTRRYPLSYCLLNVATEFSRSLSWSKWLSLLHQSVIKARRGWCFDAFSGSHTSSAELVTEDAHPNSLPFHPSCYIPLP